MECRTLDLTLISAKGLKNASLAGKMDVYAVVSVSGTFQKLKTPVNKGGGPNPIWNFPMKFTIDEAAAVHNRLTLVVKIKAAGMFVNRQLGEVHVPIKELMEGDVKSMQFVSYHVRRPSGKTKGELSFSYKFGEKFSVKAEDPVTAYPPGRAVGSSSGYPPPYATGYPSQAQGGYAYASYPPPPPPVYGGYPPQQRPNSNRSGMGLGTGLIGGALGGMLLGSMLSDGGGGCGGGCGGCGGGCGGGGCGGF